jgi:hypothetical protein
MARRERNGFGSHTRFGASRPSVDEISYDRIENRASGFCTLDAFTDMIFLCVGELLARSPGKARTVS